MPPSHVCGPVVQCSTGATVHTTGVSSTLLTYSTTTWDVRGRSWVGLRVWSSVGPRVWEGLEWARGFGKVLSGPEGLGRSWVGPRVWKGPQWARGPSGLLSGVWHHHLNKRFQKSVQLQVRRILLALWSWTPIRFISSMTNLWHSPIERRSLYQLPLCHMCSSQLYHSTNTLQGRGYFNTFFKTSWSAYIQD